MKQFLLVFLFCIFSFALKAQEKPVSLAGKWCVALDVFNQGTREEWYKKELPKSKDLHITLSLFFRRGDYLVNDWILLPGTMEESNIGVKLYPGKVFSGGLQKKISYDGPFWIQRTVSIPPSWSGKTVIFSMERTIGVSTMYWDGQKVGESFGYEAPHQFEINSSLTSPGDHTISVYINRNDSRHPQGGHGVYSENGTTWTGVVGKIEMQARNSIYVDNLQIYPNIDNGTIKVSFGIGQYSRQAKDITINFSLRKKKEGNLFEKVKSITVKAENLNRQHIELSLPKPVELWSEFNPNLYELKTELLVNGIIEDISVTSFGMRKFTTINGNFSLNGNKVFLRRTEYDGASPIKNYPSMEKTDWDRIMRIAKEYGLNSLRFHTWCPPEAAFEAADESGIMFQVELPTGKKSDYPPPEELKKILDSYGNHPSFCMLSLSNEWFSHNEASKKTIIEARQYDSRHLYTCTSHPLARNCVDDYYEAANDDKGNLLVGIQWGGGDVVSTTRFNTKPPETQSDYSAFIKDFTVPIVTHEVGQWAMFPNLKEISKYTGCLQNTNYERIRQALEDKGLLKYADDFAMASGKFSAILYKEEIESAIRTSGLGGFCLLNLSDFQGQNLAVVGILDAFWDSKGIISPKEHRMYCSSIVPLARMTKRVWKQNEVFTASAEIAHFGEKDLLKVQPVWTITTETGKVIYKGQFTKTDIPVGGLASLGNISISLKEIEAPQKLILSIEIPSTEIKNTWDLWVYPSEVNLSNGKVKVFNTWDSNLKKALESGESVLLLPKLESLKDGYRASCFTTVFWNSLFKGKQKAHTLGILCDPSNPVFSSFPTDSYSNWQWWDVTMHANAMYLNNIPKQLKPLVQVIDSYHLNDRLAYIWECKVGKGKLLVSTVDFTTEMDKRTVSKQLEKSILEYMNSEKFNPTTELNFQMIDKLFYSMEIRL